MKRLVIVSLAALAACNAADDGPKTAEQAAEEMAEAPRMKPGNWQTTIKMTKFDMPGAPPQAKQMMEGMLAQVQTTDTCVTPEEANRDPREFLKQTQQGNCSFQRFNVSGGEVDAQMLCKPEQGGQANVMMTGDIGAERVTMAVESKVSGVAPENVHGEMTMAMTMTSVRTGDCPTGGTQ